MASMMPRRTTSAFFFCGVKGSIMRSAAAWVLPLLDSRWALSESSWALSASRLALSESRWALSASRLPRNAVSTQKTMPETETTKGHSFSQKETC